MPKLVLHLFHADPAALATVPTLAERIHQAPDRAEFNARIDSLVRLDVRVTSCIGLAQQAGAEAAFRARGLVLESAAVAFPRFAAEGATLIAF